MKKKSLLLILLLAIFAPFAMMGQETFALYEDATGSNSYVPVYGNWADAGDATAEFIIPATDIDVMTGGTISQMTFFLKSAASSAWNAPYEVYLSETDATELTGLVGHNDATLVFTGTLNGNSATMDVVFSNGYTYGGGNLLVGFYETGEANYSSASFKGVATSTNTAYYGYTGYSSYTSSATQFIPSITFTYELPQGDCEAPATLVADPVDAHEATLTWTGGSGTYNVLYKTAAQSWDEATTAESNLSAYTCTLSGLAANTNYQARVISVCDVETSNPKGVSFTTPIACPAPTGFAVAVVPGDGTQAVFSWTNGGEETEWQLCIDGDENNLITMTENPFTYNQFTPEQTYTAKMRAYCDNIDQSTWTNTVTFTPTDAYMLTVNDGEGTNEYVPFYGYYADSGCQGEFIIPADDLSDMQWGTISQLTFYVQNPASADFVNSYNGDISKFEVYMSETESTTISAVDWSGIKVKNEAQLVITDYQMVVTLDQPYQYMGGNLMIGFKETSNGGYAHTYWYGVTAEGASMGGYGSSISQKDFLPKTTFAYIPGEEPSCYMPTGVTVNYTAGTEATVSWTSEATAWNMKVNGTPVEGTITNPYTLENLELGTTYEIQVQAICDGSVSDWTPAVSFTTDDCLVADMCAVTIELTDSYSDGWSGGKLEVVNAANNMVLGTYTLEDDEGDETFELYVCDGTTINFVYTTGSYATENGWYITDINGEVIAEHEGCNSGCAVSSGIIATYTMNCTPATCIKPTDFTVVAYGTTAEISWTAGGEETAWQLCVNDDEDNLIDVTENPYTLEGLTVSTDYTVRLRANCGDDDYSNWTSNVSFTTLECEDACAISYVLTANAYQGGYSYGWYNSGIKVFDANTDEQIDFLTVGNTSDGIVTGTLPLCNGREIYFQWYSYYSTSNDNILVGGYAIYDNKGELIAGESGPMSENVEYTMDCSVPSCMWPINFAVEPSYTSAEISWDGSAEHGYNVQYRKAPIFFYEGFEYGFDDQGWTTIVNGEVPSSGDFVNGWATYNGQSHNGSKSAASRSWVSDGTQSGLTLAADNYLITPQLEIQGTLKFWVKCSYPSSADEYEVLLSTGGTEIRDFNVTLKDMTAATGDWEEIVIDRALSEYVGQRCYIAIHHVYEDGELLLVDDFGLYGTEEDAGKWNTATTEVASIVINDLEMDSWYEYLVQGVCEEEESEWRGGTFHTLNGNVKTFNNDGYWNEDDNWFPAGVPTANQTAVINAEARIPAGCIATAAITIGQNGSLVVEDGGQLHNMGDPATVTMEKNITGYGEGNDNWYLISSGVFTDISDVTTTGIINDVSTNYDFFEFDGTAEGAEWVNKKDNEYFDMIHGFGYLYANKEDVTLRFTGDAQTYAEGPYWYATAYYLTYDADKPFGTLNLVGNCLTHDAQLYLYGTSLDLITDYYKMYETEEGSKVMLSGDETIAPNEGVFIEATESEQRLVIGAPETNKGGHAMLNIALLSNGSKVDMARVRFGEGNNLTKFQFKADQSKLYIPQNDKNYAVVYGQAAGEMPLNFKAEKIGTYTISFKAEAMQFNYLHLFDKITGTDVNLNVNNEYTFIGTPRDMEDRFIIRFSEGAIDSDIFAYQSGDDIIVNGEGTLQVFDVMGRFVGSYEVNGNARISAEQFSNAVYIFRLIGNEIKTQKIVVR